MDVTVILNEIECVKTSYGFGDDDIYIVTELYDFSNTSHPLLGRTLSHIGNMSDSGPNKTKTQRDNPHLKPIGDRANYLMSLSNISFDSLTCIMFVIKAGPFTSYKTGPQDPVDTSGEAQKAEADVASDLVKEIEERKATLEKELQGLEDDVKKATGQTLTDLEKHIKAVRAEIAHLTAFLQKIHAGVSVGGEILQLILDFVAVFLFLKKSWGSTVALGQDKWKVPIPPQPLKGLHPPTGSHEFTCTGFGAIYNVKYQIGIA